MKAVLDAGVFLGVERRDRRIGAMLRVLEQRRVPLWTSAGVVAQVWRNGARQALLARVLAGTGIQSLGTEDGKRTGQLQGVARTDDVVDAHLALTVASGDHVLTSDPRDIARLLAARGVEATVVRI